MKDHADMTTQPVVTVDQISGLADEFKKLDWYTVNKTKYSNAKGDFMIEISNDDINQVVLRSAPLRAGLHVVSSIPNLYN